MRPVTVARSYRSRVNVYRCLTGIRRVTIVPYNSSYGSNHPARTGRARPTPRPCGAAPLTADGLAAILATAERPRTNGRGVESHTTAHRRGRLDAVIDQLTARGVMEASALYEPPFSNLHAGGPEALFGGKKNVIEGIFDTLKAVQSGLMVKAAGEASAI